MASAANPIVVVDTSVFTNPDCYNDLGRSKVDALIKVLKHVKATGVVLYMTPGCVAELGRFVDLAAVDPGLMVHLRIRAPDRDAVRLSGAFVHELVCNFRERGDKSIKQGIAVLRDAYATAPEPRKRASKAPDPVCPYINRLRDGTRHHLREGFIDSGEDMDTLLLARQLQARLASGDKGMVAWGHRMGIEHLPHALLLSV